uniref:Chromosome-associated kinesin KIF4-like n=1 Tax=Petromyzon marinus TaxID=7757 RepID=A0AAJ7WLM7_PETMA|nr:chromosome-associated kinesin KIF4-like [Petromyzon marinus]
MQKEQLEQIAQLRAENKSLQQKVQQVQRTKKRLPAALGAAGEQTGPRAASPDSSLEFVLPRKSTAKQRRPSAPARPLVSLSHILSETETSDSDGGPVDADWQPGGAVAPRPSLQRRSKSSTAAGCRCGGRCVNRLCGCLRAGLECAAWRCGCDHDKCRNRSDAGGKMASGKLETSSSSDGSFKRDEPSGVARPPGESFFMAPDVAPSPQVLKEMGDTGLLSALLDPSLRTSLLTNASPAQELHGDGGGDGGDGGGSGGSGGGGGGKKRRLLGLGHSGLLAACSPVPPL